jgi:hypothetical protein
LALRRTKLARPRGFSTGGESLNDFRDRAACASDSVQPTLGFDQ